MLAGSALDRTNRELDIKRNKRTRGKFRMVLTDFEHMKVGADKLGEKYRKETSRMRLTRWH